jgi:hypothetical protein
MFAQKHKPPASEDGRYRRKGQKLDKEVESEKKHSEKEKEKAPREAALRELDDGTDKTSGNDNQTGSGAARIEWSGRDIAGQIPAEERNFVIKPERKFVTATPAIKRT